MPAHSVLAVIGPNGSGKSTLFNAVTGLVSAESGRVRFAGQEIGGLAPHLVLARGIARTFQNIRLFPNLTVLENVLIGMHARLHTGAVEALLRLPRTRREEQEARDKAMEILAVFGNRLMPRVDHVVSSLSYANRRRVARAHSRPKLLLLDERPPGGKAETLDWPTRSRASTGSASIADRARLMSEPANRLSSSITAEDRRGLARRGAAERRGDPRLSRPERRCCLSCCSSARSIPITAICTF
jgi:ABC-type sugar transport system ATPase subunit